MLRFLTLFLILSFCSVILSRTFEKETDFINYSKNSNYRIKNYKTSNEKLNTNLSKVHFYLHTSDNPSIGERDELILGDVDILHNSHYKSNGSLKLLIHGYNSDIHGFPYNTGSDLLITDPNGNVVLLDWSELAGGLYNDAVDNVYAVSNYTAKFIKFLMDEGVVTPERIHCIGFSLGGQACGIIGKRFQWLMNKNIGRITSMDPAKPYFDFVEDDDRISSDDGDFVDVIHTNGGKLGMEEPSGHADFYPNGGKLQPGCGFDPIGTCSHSRAAELFKESILGKTEFRSCKCKNWSQYQSGNCPCNETANLGYYVDKRVHGSFYLKTNQSHHLHRDELNSTGNKIIFSLKTI